MKSIERGQVWIETVTPTLSPPEPWQRLHFVHEVKHWWVADRRREYVISVSRDDSHQTLIEDFSRFEFSGFSIDMDAPCVEQLSLTDLRQISEGCYSPLSGDGLVESAMQLIGTLDTVGQVGGFQRKRQVEKAIVELRAVAKFLGLNTAELDKEIWIRGIA
jgi:hypothetical protein